MTSPAHTVSAAMLKSIRYDAVKDYAPVSLVADSAFVFVARKNFPADDIKGLVALAKASPGKLNFADVGVGSTQNFAGELMRQMAGIDVKHIPYSNTPGVVTALLSGDVDYGVELAHAVRGQGYAVIGGYGWTYPAGTPDSAAVGTSGIVGQRAGEPTASSFNWPACTW